MAGAVRTWHVHGMTVISRKSAGYILCLVAGLLVSAPDAAFSTDASCPPDLHLAKLVAGSDFILTGRMQIDRQQFIAEAGKPSPNWIEIPAKIDHLMKGENLTEPLIRFDPKHRPYKPSNDAVLGLSGLPTIMFLTQVDEGPRGLYFAGYTPDALRPATEQSIGEIKAEILRQVDILRLWRADTTLPHFEEVRALIAHLGHVSGAEQQRVFDQLEALGYPAVPAIIAQMDNRQPLLTHSISLVNHAKNAFEGMRHYGPDQVVDALDAILNQITGESFGSIQNGGSDREREASVAGWRVYAATLRCQK